MPLPEKIYFRYTLLLLMFLLLTNSNTYGTPLKVEKGTINLINYSFENNKTVELSGDWAFYFKKTLTEITPGTTPDYIEVPQVWSKFGYPAKGYATYKLKIVMPKNYKNLMLSLNHQSTSYNLYINGELINSVGKFATTKEQQEPNYKKITQPIPNNLDTLEIAIEIANFYYQKSGLWDRIKLGTTTAITTSNNKLFLWNVFLFGVLTILFIYHIILSYQFKKNNIEENKIIFFFAMFVSATLLRTISTGELIITHVIPKLPWSVLIRIEFISFFMLTATFIKYIQLLFPHEFSKKITKPIFYICIGISILIIPMPVYYSSYLIQISKIPVLLVATYILICVIIAVIRKKQLSKIVLFITILLVLSVLNDVLLSQNIIKSIYLIPFAVFTYFFLQATILAELLLYTFQKNIQLSKMLLKTNEQLETRVKERTQELSDANKELNLFATIAEKSYNAIMITSPGGYVEWVNSRFTDMYGFSLKEFQDRGSTIFDANTNPEVIAPIKKVINTKKSLSYDAELSTKDGRKLWINTTWTPLLNNENKLEKLIAIDADVSQQKIIEEKLLETNKEIFQQNRQIKSSIKYAQKIQKALMAPTVLISRRLKEQYDINQLRLNYFIFLKPKDIVSGDFYWTKIYLNDIYFVAADGTGHGVPGAFMSVLGISFLNDIVNKKRNLKPDQILNMLRERVINTLRQANNEQSRDGMDISLCKINIKTMTMEYAGAYQSLYLVRKNNNGKLELTKIPGDRMPIGKHIIDNKTFTLKSIKIQKYDSFYCGSDGYISQFNEQSNETFKSHRLEDMLLNINHLDMDQQKIKIKETLKNWQGNTPQIDDILIVGLKITEM